MTTEFSLIRRTAASCFLIGLAALASGIGIGNGRAIAVGPGPAPEDRALAYLVREVQRWRQENGCFSCHNNGDGARALYFAAQFSRRLPTESLAETTRWLAEPGKWDDNPGDPAASDMGLARIQFAAALTAAVDAGILKKKAPLVEAAGLLVEDQQEDGSGRVDVAGTVGSPATYGSVLATYLARRTLVRADARRFSPAIEKANRWLLRQKAQRVLDAAAMLLALEQTKLPAAKGERQRLLEIFERGQSPEGGWGPYVNAAPEAFDTSVVLLALVELREREGVAELIVRGRRYLIATQLRDGSWTETTRPTGSESYAQRLSTTAWATMALLASESDQTRRQE